MNQPFKGSAPLDPADPALDTILSALAEAEPSPDFAQRLTATLSLRTIGKAVAVPHHPLSFPKGIRVSPNAARAFPRPRRILPWVAAITTAAVACLLVLLLPHTHSPSIFPPVPAAQQASIPKSPSRLAPKKVPTPLIHLALSTHTSARKAMAPAHAPATLTAEAQLNQQALDDLHTPSHPAPPLPPTQQERLVALMLRRGERHDLAQLETGRQELSLRQERASFSQFFDPPDDPAVRDQPRSLASQATQLTR